MAKADYENLCVEYARAVQNDLAGLLGTDVRLKGPKIAVLTAAEAARTADPLTHTVCEAQDDSGHRIHLVVPAADAAGLAGLIMAFEAEQIEAKRKEGLDDDLLDAFGEVMNMAAAILSRIGEAMALPALVRGETHRSLEAEALGEGRFRRARWRLVLPDQPEGCLEMWTPEKTLAEWFGESLDAVGPEAAEAVAPEDEEDGPLVVIDPSEADREALESLEVELGRVVWAVDPAELGTESFEGLADASAVILAWELGACMGLDVLHALRSAEATAHLPVALASSQPTRRMVLSALRSGAATFLMKPYEAREIRTRFGFATPDAMAGPGDEESSEGSGEG